MDAKVTIQPKPTGALCAIAPTIVELLGLSKPVEMDCESIIAKIE
jgi:bisphosphoglycerate-independent phosphoglycerate mutase (AlkP superfamily)